MNDQTTTKKSPRLITRSISFDPAVLDYLKARAVKERRSVNWLVNELLRKAKASSRLAG